MDNFCYIVGCEVTRNAMVIDPGADVESILAEAKKEALEIVTIVNTHTHGDHTAGNAKLQSLTGAKLIIHALDVEGYPEADILLNDEETLQVGEITYDIIHNYGPTPSSTLHWEKRNNVNAREYGYYVKD